MAKIRPSYLELDNKLISKGSIVCLGNNCPQIIMNSTELHLCHTQGHFDYESPTRDHQKEEIKSFGTISSSRKPRFGMIPFHALIAVADRFELGDKKHGDKAWNALSDQIGLENEEWVISRVEHVIWHAYLYLLKYKNLMTPEIAARLGTDFIDDDAGAIIWGGTLLHEAMRIKKEKDDQNQHNP